MITNSTPLLTPEAAPLSIPDRFEGLSRRTSSEQLGSIVVAVDGALGEIDKRYAQMRGSHRGAFLILRGESGAGKSTFLHTIGRFRQGVKSEAIPGNIDIRSYFSEIKSTAIMTVFVLEEREAAVNFTDRELGSGLIEATRR